VSSVLFNEGVITLSFNNKLDDFPIHSVVAQNHISMMSKGVSAASRVAQIAVVASSKVISTNFFFEETDLTRLGALRRAVKSVGAHFNKVSRDS
jgi:hypothetical protein